MHPMHSLFAEMSIFLSMTMAYIKHVLIIGYSLCYLIINKVIRLKTNRKKIIFRDNLITIGSYGLILFKIKTI